MVVGRVFVVGGVEILLLQICDSLANTTAIPDLGPPTHLGASLRGVSR